MMRKRGRPPHPDILTPREWQVLDLIRQDLTNEQIAHRLDISPATAKYHVSEILSKLNLTTREQAAAWQPEPVPARRWWAVALAWAARRAWPLAGAAGTLAAVAALAWIAFGASAGNDGDTEGDAAGGPTTSASPIPSPTATPAPSPVVVNQPIDHPRQPLEPDAPITDQGTYLLEVGSGQLWRAPASEFSPDGRQFAVLGEGGSLDIVDVDSGAGTRIVAAGVSNVIWSKNGGGQLIFDFSPADGSRSATYIIDANGSGLRRLFDVVYPYAQWAMSGRYAAFTSFVTIPEGQRMQLTVVGTETGRPATLAMAIPFDPITFAWSPIDHRLAYATKDGLFLYDPDTAQSTTISGGPIAGGVQWSPDGTKILAPAGEYKPFVGGLDTRLQLMHLFDVAGGHPPIELPPGVGHSWSPDFSRMAYVDFGCISGEWDIYTMAPDGTNVVRLTATPNEIKGAPQWSPDGSTLAYNTVGDLRLLDVKSQEQTFVAKTNYDSGLGQILYVGGKPWSANGRYLLFGAGGAHGVCT